MAHDGFPRKQTLKRSPKMLNCWYTLIFNVNYSFSGIKKFKTEKMKSEISLLKLFSLFVNCILKNLLIHSPAALGGGRLNLT